MSEEEKKFLEIVDLKKGFGSGETRQEVLRGMNFSVAPVPAPSAFRRSRRQRGGGRPGLRSGLRAPEHAYFPFCHNTVLL